MNQLPYGHTRNVSLARALLRLLWRTAARVGPPMATRAVSVCRDPRARQLATILLLLVGLLVQVVLLLVAGYLIDLGISLMELWAELARKHLELTL